MFGTGMPGAAGGAAGQFARGAGVDFPGAGAGFDGPLAPLGRGAGGPLGRGGPGGGASTKPANFNTPRGAVQAFLDALKARDLDRLTEATALHAEVEASEKNRPIFSAILDGSLGADQLDDIANKLEGYTVSGQNLPKSTGRVKVTVSKNEKRVWTRRQVTVRREKAGWKVVDIGGEGEIRMPGVTNKTPGTQGARESRR
jgi:hypothetical protein